MSDYREKFARPASTSGGRAQATYDQLRRRYGFEPDAKDEDRVRIMCMGNVECWIRISGKGDKALFEKHDL